MNSGDDTAAMRRCSASSVATKAATNYRAPSSNAATASEAASATTANRDSYGDAGDSAAPQSESPAQTAETEGAWESDRTQSGSDGTLTSPSAIYDGPSMTIVPVAAAAAAAAATETTPIETPPPITIVVASADVYSNNNNDDNIYNNIIYSNIIYSSNNNNYESIELSVSGAVTVAHPESQSFALGSRGSNGSTTPRSSLFSLRASPQAAETLTPSMPMAAAAAAAASSRSSDDKGSSEGEEVTHRVRRDERMRAPSVELAVTITPVSVQNFLFPDTALAESDAGSSQSLPAGALRLQQQQQQHHHTLLLRDRFADDENRINFGSDLLGTPISTRHMMGCSTQDTAMSGSAHAVSHTPSFLMLPRVESDVGSPLLLGPEQPRERHSLQRIVIMSAAQSESRNGSAFLGLPSADRNYAGAETEIIASAFGVTWSSAVRVPHEPSSFTPPPVERERGETGGVQ